MSTVENNAVAFFKTVQEKVRQKQPLSAGERAFFDAVQQRLAAPPPSSSCAIKPITKPHCTPPVKRMYSEMVVEEDEEDEQEEQKDECEQLFAQEYKRQRQSFLDTEEPQLDNKTSDNERRLMMDKMSHLLRQHRLAASVSTADFVVHALHWFMRDVLTDLKNGCCHRLGEALILCEADGGFVPRLLSTPITNLEETKQEEQKETKPRITLRDFKMLVRHMPPKQWKRRMQERLFFC